VPITGAGGKESGSTTTPDAFYVRTFQESMGLRDGGIISIIWGVHVMRMSAGFGVPKGESRTTTRALAALVIASGIELGRVRGADPSRKARVACGGVGAGGGATFPSSAMTGGRRDSISIGERS
jgi:hypothetical protein